MDTAEKLMTAEKLENLVAQMKSSEEDQILTLNIIDHYDVMNNLIFFILLKKKGNLSWDMWKQHAPNATQVLQSVVGESPNLTFQYMIEIAAKEKVNVQQLQYFMDEFGDHVLDVLKSYGYDFIEKVSITLTEKHTP